MQLFLPGLDVLAAVVALAPVVAAGIVKLSFLVWPSAKLVLANIKEGDRALRSRELDRSLVHPVTVRDVAQKVARCELRAALVRVGLRALLHARDRVLAAAAAGGLVGGAGPVVHDHR